MKRKVMSDWSPEAVSRFWDYWGTKTGPDNYFSAYYGHALAEFLRLAGLLRGKWIDYGCGPGYFAEALLKTGADIEVQGADFSPRSVESANRKVEGFKGWLGATQIDSETSLPSDSFDGVTCIEVVEHLTDEALEVLVIEVQRLLKIGGIALFSTPNAENLEESMILCPFCDSEFHKIQHVRSWSGSELQQVLERAGFEVLFSRDVNLDRFSDSIFFPASKLDWSLRHIAVRVRDRFARLRDKPSPETALQGREFQRRLVTGPHLLALARKKGF